MENKFIRYSELSDNSKGFTLTSNVYVDNAVDIIMKSLMIGFTLGIFTYFVITKAIGIDGAQRLLLVLVVWFVSVSAFLLTVKCVISYKGSTRKDKAYVYDTIKRYNLDSDKLRQNLDYLQKVFHTWSNRSDFEFYLADVESGIRYMGVDDYMDVILNKFYNDIDLDDYKEACKDDGDFLGIRYKDLVEVFGDKLYSYKNVCLGLNK